MTNTPMQKYYLFIGLFSLLVISVLIYGFSLVGTPSDAANRSKDKNAIRSIQTTANNVFAFYRTNRYLPGSLSDLPRLSYTQETSLLPEYKLTSSSAFELCTIFNATNSVKGYAKETTYNESSVYQLYYETYPIQKGPACFKFSVTPAVKIETPPVRITITEPVPDSFDFNN